MHEYLAVISGLRRATIDEADALTQLINEAFAPEVHFRAGARTNVDAIRKHFQTGIFFVVEEQGTLNACVYLEPRGEAGYLGMLSVMPSLQRRGLGRRLMAFAERELAHLGCRRTEILIVNANTHLVTIYAKLGYVETGTAQYPPEIRTKFPVHFIRMEKPIEAET